MSVLVSVSVFGVRVDLVCGVVLFLLDVVMSACAFCVLRWCLD